MYDEQKALEKLYVKIDEELSRLKEDIIEILNFSLNEHPQYKLILDDFIKEKNIRKWAKKLKSDINLSKTSSLPSLMFDYESVRNKS